MRVVLVFVLLLAAGEAQAQWNNNWVFKTIREQKQTEPRRTVLPALPQRRAPAAPAPKAATPSGKPQTGISETVSPAIGPLPPS